MNLRSFASLATCTATVATASTLWANPAHAVLLRFTGSSFNGSAVSFDYDPGSEDIDIRELGFSEDPEEPYTSFIKDFSFIPNVFPIGGIEFFVGDVPLLVSPISPSFEALLGDPSQFGEKEYTINFSDISAIDSDGAYDLTLSGSYSFVLAADIEDRIDAVSLFELDLIDNSSGSLDASLLTQGEILIEEIEEDEVTSVPEARTYVGLALIGLLGMTQLGCKRFKAL